MKRFSDDPSEEEQGESKLRIPIGSNISFEVR